MFDAPILYQTPGALARPYRTYGYKILHKIVGYDIIGLHPRTRLTDLRIGLPADRDEQEEPIVADPYRGIEAEIPRLRRYARALTRDPGAADDLVQECLTRALDKIGLWHSGTDLRAWLFTILHNQHVNHIRRAMREGMAVKLNESEPQLARAPQQAKRLELRDLERAIAKLPDEQRSVILLVGLEGMRYEDVASVLDVPVGTVRSRLSRGRDALRRLTGVSPDEHPGPVTTGSDDPCRPARRFSGPAGRSEIAIDRARLASRERAARRTAKRTQVTDIAPV